MTVVVFVHGTGVRQSDFDTSFELIKSKVKTHWGLDASPCYWGGELGATLRQRGASIPDYEKARDKPRTDELTAWELLYRDPMFEIRNQVSGPDNGDVIGKQAQCAEKVREALKEGAPADQLEKRVKDVGFAPIWQTGIDHLFAMPGFSDFVNDAGENSDYERGIARALIALATTSATARGVPAPSGKVRDALVEAVVERLGGKHMGVGGWVVKKLWPLVQWLGQPYVEKKRGGISDDAMPKLGDILVYQLRGEKISNFIKDNVKACQEPVIVVAHSLGGIASLEMMIDDDAPSNVKALVTVGSQGPLLYELDCLRSLQDGKKFPGVFVPWVNVYDKADFLSYIGEKLLPGSVVDIQVDNDQPFPEAHSAYWQNDDMWKALRAKLAGVLVQ
ncbi:hypothetical protein LFL96_19795 [Paraburkholderia sp. D15]|uniref:hypothetical protein n=1 Tax=Paraburkholderia sp. D15 TaxID=2880218 RepID=UPI00247A61C6|nr:hypothetical protein [Paraburkholderia sp. D15]WGS53320.1 hypothetical protein LFL96_19795 [Paraburkholderia sp. D15]